MSERTSMFRKNGEPKISTKTQTRSTSAPMPRYWGEPKGSCTLPLPLHMGTNCGAGAAASAAGP